MEFNKTTRAPLMYGEDTPDGSEPNINSNRYTKRLKLHSTTEIKAISIKKGVKNSAITRASFRLRPPEKRH